MLNDAGAAVAGAGRDTGSARRSGPWAHPCALGRRARCALRGTVCATALELGHVLGVYPRLFGEMRAMMCGSPISAAYESHRIAARAICLSRADRAEKLRLSMSMCAIM